MSRATPRFFLQNLKELGFEVKPIDETNVLGPKKLFRALSRRGVDIENSRPSAAQLKTYGFEPTTVIDIGVDHGTPMIYDAYPDAKFILIDPLHESEKSAEKLKGIIDFEFHCCALGPKNGSVTMTIPSTETKVRTSRATALNWAEGNKSQFAKFEDREVPMKTLDSLTKNIEGPIGIKIDTEGFELDVMKGAKATLKKTEFVLAEASIKRRYVGGYRFSELVAFMGKQGFEILDFPRPIRTDADDCDVMFVRNDSERFDF